MPVVISEDTFTGFAHCNNARCAGYQQQEVQAVRQVVGITFVERGGDLPGIETSRDYLRFAKEEDRVCPACGNAREVTDQKRKTYAPLSGHSPDGLLKYGAFNPDAARQAQAAAAVSETQGLRDEMDQLRAELAALKGDAA